MLHTLILVKLTNNEKVLLQNIIKTRPRNSTSHIFPQLLALACCWGQLTVYMYISSIDSVRLNCVFLRFASAKTFIPFCRQGKREVCDRWRVVANKWRPLFSFFFIYSFKWANSFFFFYACVCVTRFLPGALLFAWSLWTIKAADGLWRKGREKKPNGERYISWDSSRSCDLHLCIYCHHHVPLFL